MRQGWAAVALGDVFKTVTGSTPPKSNPEYYGTFAPFVKPPELTNGPLSTADDGLSEFGVSVARVAPVDSVLVSCIGNLGKIGLAARDVAFNQQINAIFPNETKAIPKFMFYQALSDGFREQLAAMSSGTTVSIVNKSRFNSVLVVVPPLPEQQRIVAILDEAFAGLATATANAEKNLRNAGELFESCLNCVFSSPKSTWIVCPLAECVEFVTYGFTNPMPTTETGPWMVTAKNVVGGKIDYASARHTSHEAFSKLLTDKSRPKIGDVLLTKDGTLGRLAVVDRDQICINQSVALLRPNGRMVAHLMKYLLSSRDYQRRMIGEADGATIKHIYITRVPKMDVAFPTSSSEQRELVAKLDALSNDATELESAYLRKLESLRDLKQAILERAFSGELTSPPSQAIKEAAE